MIIFLIIINLLIFIFIKRINRILNIYDSPDKKRKIHKIRIAKTGGIIIFINLILFYVLNLQNYFFFNLLENSNVHLILFGGICFFILGLIDDIRDLNPNLKLFLTTVIILIVLLNEKSLIIESLRFSFLSDEISLRNFQIPFTVLCILLFINAINMYDGINLQTLLYTSILITSNLIISDNLNFIIYLLPILFSLIILNFKNIIFLGDSGTLLIGFILSSFFILNYNDLYIKYSDTIFIFMMLPGLELLRLAFSRILKKRNPFSADRTHIHHLFLKRHDYYSVVIFNFILVMTPVLLVFFTNLPNLTIISLFIMIYAIIIFKYQNIDFKKK